MILVVEVGVPIGFGAIAFGVPVRGSLIDLVVICVLASLSFSALGLLIASRARTIEAVSGLMNLVQVPMWILSGVFFSAQRFPEAVQPLIQALPLTAIIDALRAHMLQGATLAQMLPQLATMTASADRVFHAGAEAVSLAVRPPRAGVQIRRKSRLRYIQNRIAQKTASVHAPSRTGANTGPNISNGAGPR